MSVQQRMEQKLSFGLQPLHLEVVNESGMHNVPDGSETHFKVLVVSERFRDQRPVNRHRIVNGLLGAELAGPVHALALHTMTPEEWFERAGTVGASPPCLGGGKADLA